MQDFRQYIHKLSTVGLATPIDCGELVTFTGNTGIFFFSVTVGTDLGTVVLDYESFDIPDRFIMSWDGSPVADSLYVGDSLTGNPPDYTGLYAPGGFVGSSYTDIPSYIWDGTQFVASGTLPSLDIIQADIAPFGETAGNGSISFEKSAATPSVVLVGVYAPLGGTAWEATVNCPVDNYSSISLGYDASVAATACTNHGSSPSTYYILTAETFATATVLSTTTAFLTAAPAGEYSDGVVSRNWDGAAFTGDTAC